jgi:hypothetical protein
MVRFWTELVDRVREKTPLPAAISPNRGNWLMCLRTATTFEVNVTLRALSLLGVVMENLSLMRVSCCHPGSTRASGLRRQCSPSNSPSLEPI